MTKLTRLLGNGGHKWRFFRAGGFDQVRLDRGADLLALEQLDQKLWVALSCPVKGLEFDTRTLELIDTDKDGRIRAPEILAAVRWVCSLLKSADELVRPAEALPLAAINDANPEGRQVLAAARRVLLSLGKGDADRIAVGDTADTVRIFSQTHLNGDGVVPADAAEDPAVQGAISDILAAVGSAPDRSGKPGVNQALVDQFFTQAQAWVDWLVRQDAEAATLQPLGPATAAAGAALAAVRAKVEDYFARCRLAAFDPRALAAVNGQESEFLALAAKDLSISSAEIAQLPLAPIGADRPLPLSGPVNPAWAAALAQLRDQAVVPLLGPRPSLTLEDWTAVCGRLDPYLAWQAAKPVTPVEKLGAERLRALLAAPVRQAITELINQDLALAGEFDAIAALDRLVRYHRDLYQLLCNYVNFHSFYSRHDRSIFQAGRLYLDQRSCDLCVRVDDMGKQGVLAQLSRLYIAYCDCVRPATGQKMTIAACFTAGDSDNLMVGRNGVFYDRQGNDWDATIVKVVENPISIRQAFWSPYKRLVRWIEEQVAKRAAAADQAADQGLAQTLTTATTPPAAGGAATAAKQPSVRKIDVGTVAAIGVAMGSIGTFLAMLATNFMGLGPWMPVGLAALVLIISGPSMLIAGMKLRQRNLGPLLDANGWAINTRAKINIPFGRSLTGMAALPSGAQRDLFDPFAEKKRWRYKVAVLVLILAGLVAAWYFGLAERIIPGVLPKSGWVIKHEVKPTASLTGVRFGALTAGKVKLSFEVEIDNPFGVALSLKTLDYSMAASSGQVLKGIADLKGTLPVPPKQSKTLTLSTEVPVADVQAFAKAVPSGTAVSYSPDTKLTVDAPTIGPVVIPLTSKNEIMVPPIPGK